MSQTYSLPLRDELDTTGTISVRRDDRYDVRLKVEHEHDDTTDTYIFSVIDDAFRRCVFKSSFGSSPQQPPRSVIQAVELFGYTVERFDDDERTVAELAALKRLHHTLETADTPDGLAFTEPLVVYPRRSLELLMNALTVYHRIGRARFMSAHEVLLESTDLSGGRKQQMFETGLKKLLDNISASGPLPERFVSNGGRDLYKYDTVAASVAYRLNQMCDVQVEVREPESAHREHVFVTLLFDAFASRYVFVATSERRCQFLPDKSDSYPPAVVLTAVENDGFTVSNVTCIVSEQSLQETLTIGKKLVTQVYDRYCVNEYPLFIRSLASMLQSHLYRARRMLDNLQDGDTPAVDSSNVTAYDYQASNWRESLEIIEETDFTI